jgi:hypothetical protein
MFFVVVNLDDVQYDRVVVVVSNVDLNIAVVSNVVVSYVIAVVEKHT